MNCGICKIYFQVETSVTETTDRDGLPPTNPVISTAGDKDNTIGGKDQIELNRK